MQLIFCRMFTCLGSTVHCIYVCLLPAYWDSIYIVKTFICNNIARILTGMCVRMWCVLLDIVAGIIPNSARTRSLLRDKLVFESGRFRRIVRAFRTFVIWLYEHMWEDCVGKKKCIMCSMLRWPATTRTLRMHVWLCDGALEVCIACGMMCVQPKTINRRNQVCGIP